MPEVLTETEPEAICVECKSPFTFANSQAVNTRDSVLYCSPKCEAGLNIEGRRRALERAVIEAAKEWRKDTIVDEPLKDVVDNLVNFESQHTDKR